ncbi:hypothetical protein OPW02_17665 [Vibrio europaeus]|uniref:hypothetical protein n=1 Tax=Vibrio europaeus TaxID=300876 RepID=UPI00233EE605|nr:hypothetical protein [Vibrio europaeus]MDC5706411.1 hypothetical protein [Vibrio europaeus]MDC5708457.1 hypothetical protein [Vibrio europaeus]MDC5711726.1 hypothetical protein [Vibrio europaeus]MDC5714160.1 hypothetical protein [Vibrio europaeus]MDC5716201.1 hypothetical protein [Vibrio europaeus]
MRFAINFLLGVLLLMTLMLSVPSHAKEGCDFGLKPDGTCRNACEFLGDKAATRTMSWDAYIWGQDPKAACIGDTLGIRCGMAVAGSQICVGVGENGSTIVGTRCTGKWKFTGATCSGSDFSGGTVPSVPDPDPEPTPPPIPDNDHTSIPIISVVGFGTLGAQIAGGDNAINNQIKRGWGRLESLGYAQMTADQKQHDQIHRNMVQTGSTLSMLTSSVSNLSTVMSTKKETPWTEKTLKELIDGIKILSDCTKNGKIIDPTNGTEIPCTGSGSGGSSGGGDNGSGNGTDNELLSQINDATGLTAGRVFGLQRSNEMMSNWIGETLEGMRYSDKTFTKPAKPEFKTPFKDGLTTLQTEIEELNKEIETKLSKSPINMGSMHFNGGSYQGTDFVLDNHGQQISVGFNFLSTINPHIDLIKGVILLLAFLAGAVIILSSGRSS